MMYDLEQRPSNRTANGTFNSVLRLNLAEVRRPAPAWWWRSDSLLVFARLDIGAVLFGAITVGTTLF